MRKRRRLSALAFLLSLSSQALFSETEYRITETQLQKLETLNRQQQTLIQTQERTLNDLAEQLKILEGQYRNQVTYSERLERKVKIRDGVISVTIGISAGCIAGAAVYKIMKD